MREVKKVHIFKTLYTRGLVSSANLAEGTLSPTVCVIEKDIEEHWSQDRPLGDITHDWPLPRHRTIDNNSTNYLSSK